MKSRSKAKPHSGHEDPRRRSVFPRSSLGDPRVKGGGGEWERMGVGGGWHRTRSELHGRHDPICICNGPCCSPENAETKSNECHVIASVVSWLRIIPYRCFVSSSPLLFPILPLYFPSSLVSSVRKVNKARGFP